MQACVYINKAIRADSWCTRPDDGGERKEEDPDPENESWAHRQLVKIMHTASRETFRRESAFVIDPYDNVLIGQAR